jgi:hypothetical protein
LFPPLTGGRAKDQPSADPAEGSSQARPGAQKALWWQVRAAGENVCKFSDDQDQRADNQSDDRAPEYTACG